MTLKGGSSQACAACKYQRRRCTSECPLAPYFPPDQPKLFQNAHRLFGVSNILKILKKLEPDQKPIAMWSIIFQANERERDPVHGCLGKICHLRYQIWHLEQELLSVHSRLDMCRRHHHDPSSSQLELVMAPPHHGDGIIDNINIVHQQPYGDCNEINNPGYNIDATTSINNNDNDNNNNNPIWGYGAGDINVNDDPGQFVVDVPHQPLDVINVIQQDHHQAVQDYDEMPFFDTMDDRQSYIDSKEAYDSSSEESVLKDANRSIDHLVDNELKNAAACLSLTSVN